MIINKNGEKALVVMHDKISILTFNFYQRSHNEGDGDDDDDNDVAPAA